MKHCDCIIRGHLLKLIRINWHLLLIGLKSIVDRKRILFMNVFSSGSLLRKLVRILIPLLLVYGRKPSREFGLQEDSMIRDRVVLGCPDARLQERLLREPDLSLSKAVDLCRAAEVTKAQMRSIINNTASPSASVSWCMSPQLSEPAIVLSVEVNTLQKMCPAFGKQW